MHCIHCRQSSKCQRLLLWFDYKVHFLIIQLRRRNWKLFPCDNLSNKSLMWNDDAIAVTMTLVTAVVAAAATTIAISTQKSLKWITKLPLNRANLPQKEIRVANYFVSKRFRGRKWSRIQVQTQEINNQIKYTKYNRFSFPLLLAFPQLLLMLMLMPIELYSWLNITI